MQDLSGQLAAAVEREKAVKEQLRSAEQKASAAEQVLHMHSQV